ncbi:TasA family protein [Floccifex sp.]|uniref:TasA family protein n=1 Tax=Floccifex sp. TaxID=2815810 RepID=UPI003F08E858|nr:TasA family protein [Erysipelotrichaceae bacterium]
MNTKKKVLSMALIGGLALTAVGGTLAYFTDTDQQTNVFTVGNVDITLVEKFDQGAQLMPGTKTQNNVEKAVTVRNDGKNAAYTWIEVWVPSALDDGDDNSPTAPGLGNSLHFNYGKNVTETKSTFLGSKEIDGVAYNGYVHFVAGSAPTAAGATSAQLLDQVYMDKKVTQNENGKYVLVDGKTVYDGTWNMVVNAVGFQSEGFDTIESAISEYYGKPVADYIW